MTGCKLTFKLMFTVVVPPSHLILPIKKVTNHLIYTFAEKGICLSVVLSILSQQFLRVAAQERSYKLCSCLALLVCEVALMVSL